MKKETMKKIAKSTITFGVVGGLVGWGIGKLLDRSLSNTYKEGFSDGVDAQQQVTEFTDLLQEAIDKQVAED